MLIRQTAKNDSEDNNYQRMTKKLKKDPSHIPGISLKYYTAFTRMRNQLSLNIFDLNLDGANLQSVFLLGMMDLRQLRQLNLSNDNRLVSLKGFQRCLLDSLEVLYLRNNYLKGNLNLHLIHMPEISQIYLNENYITNIQTQKLLYCCQQLQTFELRKGKKIQMETLSQVQGHCRYQKMTSIFDPFHYFCSNLLQNFRQKHQFYIFYLILTVFLGTNQKNEQILNEFISISIIQIIINCKYLKFSMNELCQQHKNKIQRICLNKDCEHRALCLLCDHPHGNPFQSIMAKTSQSYKTFESSINKSIDTYLLVKQQSTQNKVLAQQISLIKKYFAQLKIEFDQFLIQMEKEVIQKLQSDQAENFKAIKRARISKNYVNVPQHIFQILVKIYEGTPFNEVFKKAEGSKTQEAYHYSLKMHDELKNIMQQRNYRMRTKLPDLRQIILQEESSKIIQSQVDFEIQMSKPKYEVKLIKNNPIDFESIISDCVKVDDYFLATSYDKTVKIIDKNFNVKGQKEYSNILTKIYSIADDVYALGQSKEIQINNIKFQKNQFKVQNIMQLRGHTQKINDISSLNSRIIGSSSSEGVKLWDLYKEKCQYTLSQQANPTVISFIPSSSLLVVGYNSHLVKLYSVQTMKLIKKYQLQGVPLHIDKGKFTQNKFYLGGFPSLLGILDIRLSKLASEFNTKKGAVTCISDSLYDQNAVGIGDRDGNCQIFDIRNKRSRISWQAHTAKTSISKPRGIINIFEQSETQWVSLGCNDKSFKVWNIQNVQKNY